MHERDCARPAATHPGPIGIGDPVVVSPAEGTTVSSNWTGPLTVDFTNAPETSWDVVILCGLTTESEQFATVASTTAETTTLSWSIGHRLPSGTPCRVTVAEQVGGAHAISSNFGVGFATLAPTAPSLDRATFYPRVVDGYADTVTVRYTLNRPASVVVAMLSSSGAVVRTYAPGVVQRGERRWSWNGRRTDGTRAPLGKYRMRVTAKAAGVTRRATTSTVTLATKTVQVRASASRWGDGGAPSTRGSCYIERSADEGTADLDCWGGNFARMRYSFAVPATARNFSWAVAGEWSISDICCDGGLRRTGSRPSARRFVVDVTINGWRAYLVQRVRLNYTVPRVY